MLVKLFNKSYILQYVLIIITGAVLWLGAFIHPAELVLNPDHLISPGKVFIQWVSPGSLVVSTVIAFLLMLSGAFLLNYIVTKNNIFPKNSLVPALIYIILMSHNPEMLWLNPALFTVIFILLVLDKIFLTYNRSEDYESIYLMGFLISIASFFYIPAIFLVFFIWFTFLAYRLSFWREWIIVLFGLMTPYLFLWTYYFWIEELDQVFNAYAESFAKLDFFTFNTIDKSYLYYLIIVEIVFFFIWSFYKVGTVMGQRVIHYRKMLWSLMWLLFISILIYLFSGFGYGNTLLILIPVSIFIASGMTELRHTFWSELALGALVVMIILNNYLVLVGV